MNELIKDFKEWKKKRKFLVQFNKRNTKIGELKQKINTLELNNEILREQNSELQKRIIKLRKKGK